MADGKRPLIIIGQRMGGGKKIAAGIEAAGGTAHVIPGMLADMKLGDVMHEMGADLGLSFCGSGGAGSLNAQNKYGYKAKQALHTPADFAKAVKEGYIAIGGSIQDKEEIGTAVVKAWKELHGE